MVILIETRSTTKTDTGVTEGEAVEAVGNIARQALRSSKVRTREASLALGTIGAIDTVGRSSNTLATGSIRLIAGVAPGTEGLVSTLSTE